MPSTHTSSLIFEETMVIFLNDVICSSICTLLMLATRLFTAIDVVYALKHEIVQPFMILLVNRRLRS